MLNNLKKNIPEKYKLSALNALYGNKFHLSSLYDMLYNLHYQKDPLTPPLQIRLHSGPFFDAQYYEKHGKETLKDLIKYCGLRPNSKILDVGCGSGQIGAAISTYINNKGLYEGFDLNSNVINWCQKNITRKYPNINFQYANIYSKRYNPTGKYQASKFAFPYSNKTFDVVILKSVFTHMLPQDLKNYLQQISQVLKKNGKCLITYYLMTESNQKNVKNHQGILDPLKYHYKNYSTTDKTTPESAIAYDEKFIQDLYKKQNLSIIPPILYGSWYGITQRPNVQDIIIAKKI